MAVSIIESGISKPFSCMVLFTDKKKDNEITKTKKVERCLIVGPSIALGSKVRYVFRLFTSMKYERRRLIKVPTISIRFSGGVVSAKGISIAINIIGATILKSCTNVAKSVNKRLVSKIRQARIINSIKVLKERENIIS